MNDKSRPKFIKVGNESIKLSNIKHYGIEKISNKHNKGLWPEYNVTFGDEVCSYNHISEVKILSSATHLQKIYSTNKKKGSYTDSDRRRIIDETTATKILSGNGKRLIYTLSGFFDRGYKISNAINEVAPKDDLLTIINKGLLIKFSNGYYTEDHQFSGDYWERIYFSTGEVWQREPRGIPDSWSKLNPIKSFDVEAKCDEYTNICEKMYLFVTTYQNDNFVFYEDISGFDIHAKKLELDEQLA